MQKSPIKLCLPVATEKKMPEPKKTDRNIGELQNVVERVTRKCCDRLGRGGRNASEKGLISLVLSMGRGGGRPREKARGNGTAEKREHGLPQYQLRKRISTFYLEAKKAT